MGKRKRVHCDQRNTLLDAFQNARDRTRKGTRIQTQNDVYEEQQQQAQPANDHPNESTNAPNENDMTCLYVQFLNVQLFSSILSTIASACDGVSLKFAEDGLHIVEASLQNDFVVFVHIYTASCGAYKIVTNYNDYPSSKFAFPSEKCLFFRLSKSVVRSCFTAEKGHAFLTYDASQEHGQIDDDNGDDGSHDGEDEDEEYYFHWRRISQEVETEAKVRLMPCTGELPRYNIQKLKERFHTQFFVHSRGLSSLLANTQSAQSHQHSRVQITCDTKAGTLVCTTKGGERKTTVTCTVTMSSSEVKHSCYTYRLESTFFRVLSRITGAAGPCAFDAPSSSTRNHAGDPVNGDQYALSTRSNTGKVVMFYPCEDMLLIRVFVVACADVIFVCQDVSTMPEETAGTQTPEYTRAVKQLDKHQKEGEFDLII